MPELPARRKIGDVVFECDLAGYRGTAPMYFGSYALVLIEAMKRFLKAGDVFLDVGANIGYLSAVGAGMVGRRGEVHSFEPVPKYYSKLRRLAALNPDYRMVTNPCALGETTGQAKIYVTREAGQNTMVPSYKAPGEIAAAIEVPVARLDSYIEERHLGRIALIKIDAEGFEFPILKGLSGYLERRARTGSLPAILCEIAPRAYPLMGWDVRDLEAYMAHFGYETRDLVDTSKRVDLRALRRVEDVLFLAA